MRTFKWNRLGVILAMLAILLGNVVGINALATEEGGEAQVAGPDDPPPGVLQGYLPGIQRVKTGEHFEYFGWVGAPFARLVTDYKESMCCMKTLRAMDGCKGFPICNSDQ
jgi:hypothetical protein